MVAECTPTKDQTVSTKRYMIDTSSPYEHGYRLHVSQPVISIRCSDLVVVKPPLSLHPHNLNSPCRPSHSSAPLTIHHAVLLTPLLLTPLLLSLFTTLLPHSYPFPTILTHPLPLHLKTLQFLQRPRTPATPPTSILTAHTARVRLSRPLGFWV
jgi:hypothetical protein